MQHYFLSIFIKQLSGFKMENMCDEIRHVTMELKFCQNFNTIWTRLLI